MQSTDQIVSARQEMASWWAFMFCVILFQRFALTCGGEEHFKKAL